MNAQKMRSLTHSSLKTVDWLWGRRPRTGVLAKITRQ